MIDWSAIDTVLLDMDGTLLDLHFDNRFWQPHVPLRYAEARGLPVLDAARAFGVRHLLAVRTPDTRQPAKDTRDYPAIDSFAELLGQ